MASQERRISSICSRHGGSQTRFHIHTLFNHSTVRSGYGTSPGAHIDSGTRTLQLQRQGGRSQRRLRSAVLRDRGWAPGRAPRGQGKPGRALVQRGRADAGGMLHLPCVRTFGPWVQPSQPPGDLRNASSGRIQKTEPEAHELGNLSHRGSFVSNLALALSGDHPAMRGRKRRRGSPRPALRGSLECRCGLSRKYAEGTQEETLLVEECTSEESKGHTAYQGGIHF